ncbi:MAG: 30S ribosomal protein S6 [Deltaproteobacteria bacterium]|nr:30S ribosomal protein S6 [Deltaproteobacteria bacterium]
MNYYESIFILQPDLPSEQSEKITELMSGIVEKQGGRMHIVEDWGVKRLAYEVKKQKKGHYVLMQFAGEPEGIRELERNYRVNDGVIKYMTLRIDEDKLQTITPKEESTAPAEDAETGE